MKKRSKPKNRYPNPRIKGFAEIFRIIREEEDWHPKEITSDTLITLGISPGKETQTIFALKFLTIIDEENHPTVEFDNLRNDFIPSLSKITTKAYEKVFDTIPMSLMRQKTLVNLFMQEGYSEETAEYQAKFFAWLCEESDIELPNIESTFKRARFDK